MLAKLKQLFPWMYIQGIETSTVLGFPDMLYGHDVITGFAELKSIDDRVPVRKFTVPWEAGQLAYYTRFRKKNKSPYLLILTIKDSWYITPNLKETYTMVEMNTYYIGETKDLAHCKDTILHVLFPTV